MEMIDIEEESELWKQLTCNNVYNEVGSKLFLLSMMDLRAG